MKFNYGENHANNVVDHLDDLNYLDNFYYVIFL